MMHMGMCTLGWCDELHICFGCTCHVQVFWLAFHLFEFNSVVARNIIIITTYVLKCAYSTKAVELNCASAICKFFKVHLLPVIQSKNQNIRVQLHSGTYLNAKFLRQWIVQKWTQIVNIISFSRTNGLKYLIYIID